ncbi:MAG: class I tRNA ligase family protein, partial [Candidatus Eremiobacteraeota bacterium]|nr:class I tRNA ligase family protein [Candidatus Eremiobacteraeota bacterium]
MGVVFFNTLTRAREEFVPITPGKATLYTCGPTIHDYAHIGNFRTFIFSDLVRRYLRYRGYEVFHVLNLTDVEDKIIRRSQEAGLSRADYTKKFEQAFFEDVDSLNIERCEAHPRATDPVVVDKMAEMIIGLLKDGVAYRSNDGSTYYDIKKFADYGRLANICVADLQAGARVSQDEYDKETAADFALWKAWVPEDGDVYWDQYEELGKGRPGWHIECSAMALMDLGAHFDMHLGGVDLI